MIKDMADLSFTTGLSQFADDAYLHKASINLKYVKNA